MSIDDMARCGYLYAQTDDKAMIPQLSSDMDLLAFNAGISNANIRLGLACPQLMSSTIKSIDCGEAAGHKELQTVWGQM